MMRQRGSIADVRAVRGASIVLGTALLFGIPRPARAHRDDYINETFVFETLGAREFEPELTLGDGRSEENGRFRTAALSFEYGITERWMVDGFAGWIDPQRGSPNFDRFRAETRRRFGEEGQHPVDPAASFEVEGERETQPSGQVTTSWVVTGRLVLSKDLGAQWNLTCNLDLAREFRSEGGDHWSPAYALAARYPREGFLRYGVEFRQDLGTDHRLLLVPQVWLTLPHEATFKLGLGFDPEEASTDWLLRTVFEIEI